MGFNFIFDIFSCGTALIFDAFFFLFVLKSFSKNSDFQIEKLIFVCQKVTTQKKVSTNFVDTESKKINPTK